MKRKSTIVVTSLLVVMLLVGLSGDANKSLASAFSTEANDQQPGPEMQAANVVHLFWHEAGSAPAALGKGPISAVDLGLTGEDLQDAKQISLSFLQTHGPALQATAPEIEWKPIRVNSDDAKSSHVFVQQMYKGLRVFAAEVAIHISDSAVTGANGEYLSAIELSTKPVLSVEAAFKIAVNQLTLTDANLVSSELLVYNPAFLNLGVSANHLAYLLVTGDTSSADSQTVFVDAHSGKLLLDYSNLQTGKDRDIRDLNGSTSLPGSQCYAESGPVGSPSSDCTSAYNFTGDTYDYYFNTHGRDSYDNSGATMRASVRYGTTGNAFWTGLQTAYGPGFATKDVVAHEWAHAVTQYTAGLVYSSESGALNESMSDIFGTMVDRDDWLMGEDTPGGAIRSLANPNIYGHPGKVSDSQFYCGSGDNGGVHTNSGVPNHTAYLMAEGGTYNGRTITAIGRNQTELIFYRALTTYMTSGSDFNDVYNALISASSDLYGSGSATTTNVTTALQATEMDQAVCGASPITPDIYEVDDTFSQAKNINVGVSAPDHNFHDAGDNDWAKFSASANCDYVIETFNLGSNSDTYIYLYSTNGTTILQIDDDSGSGLASRIAWTASSGGVYYVRIRHYSNSTHGSGTNYDLRVTTSSGECTAGGDLWENDDTASQASTIAVNGSAQTHNFHDAGDNDWVKFSATAGTSYLIETFNLGSSNDTFMYLYSTNSTTILRIDDDGGTGLASRIEWSAPTSGTYYVRLRHYSGLISGSNTNYDLRVTTAAPPIDIYEVDDTAAQASTITPNDIAQTHNFHDAGDNDWVKFSATVGNSYVIETFNLGSRSDTYMYLYSTNGTTLIAQNDDGGSDLASRIAWSAPASGTYFIRLRHYSSTMYGSNTNYDLRVTSSTGCSSGDVYEPDGSLVQANTLTPNGSAQTHNFFCANDNDWVKFSATVGVDYVIETFNLGSSSDTYMYLYSTDGTTLITSNDDGGSGLASRITWSAPASGVYYVRLRHYSALASGADTNYDIHVTSSGTPGTPDTYEVDDARTQANTIVVGGGGTQTHNFHDAGDNDWVKFSATAGTDYVIETLNLRSRSDTYMYLYSTDGTTILEVDDDDGGGLASRIEWTAPTSGTYYVRLRHFSSSIFGANTDYDLRVIVGSGIDIYEPDGSAAQASTITANGSAQTHNFHMAGDNDWVKFSATTGNQYVMETFNLGPTSDTFMYLYDCDGTTLIVFNDDGGDGLASRITWSAPATCTYYVRLRHYFSSTSGSTTNYDLEVISGGGDAYEPDNSPSQANTITPDGSAQTHNIHVSGDNDWVKFSTTAGTSYLIETFNLGSGSDTYMYLYSTDGTTIIDEDDDGGSGLASRIQWSAPTSGTYYIRLRHYSGSISGDTTNYDLRVTISGCGGGDSYEPDGGPAQANTITPNGSAQTHDFFCAGDNDWVKFSATAGNQYVMETFNLGSNGDTYMYLYSTNGTTIIDEDDDGGSEFLASRIEWSAPTSGIYYVRLRHYWSSASGTNTNYDLSVTSSSSLIFSDGFDSQRQTYIGPATFDVSADPALSASTATVELTVESVRVGDEVEATIYIHQAASAIKVEALAKSTYLSLSEVLPLSLGEQIIASAERWQTFSTEDGLASAWYSGKAGWDGNHSYPVLRLRWQLQAPLPGSVLVIPFNLSVVDQNGQVTTETVKVSIVMVDSDPKIFNVLPTTISNGSDSVISLQGSGFLDTPKVYLVAGSESIPLADVTFVSDEIVFGTVLAGTKADVYKILLVNPDDISVEYNEVNIVIEEGTLFTIFLPLVQK